MTSTRLPGKVIHPIMGRPMLELLTERLRRAKRLDGVVLATTTRPTDDLLEQLARSIGIDCFRGSEEDVLDRVLQAARSVRADVIVETTGDCPLLDPEVIDRLVEIYRGHRYDYVSNILERTFPRGLDAQVFSTELLARVADATCDPADREHVSLYIYSHPELFSLFGLKSDIPVRHQGLRLTVDTPEDLALITAIFERLYPGKPDFLLADVLTLHDREPELFALNRHVQQKEPR